MITALALLLVTAGDAQLSKDFAAATEKALSGDEDAARQLYQSLIERGAQHEDVWFNLGTLHAKAGRLVDACVAFEHAIELNPGDTQARDNLTLLRERLRPADREVPEGAAHIADGLTPLVGGIPRDGVRWAAVAFNFLLFGLLFVRRRASERSRGTLGVAAGLVALVTVVLVAFTAAHELVSHERRAVALAGSPLKEGPHQRYENSSTVFAGERLRVLDQDGGWLEVSGEDGRRGWMQASKVSEPL